MRISWFAGVAAVVGIFSAVAPAQTTFTYQGSLRAGSAAVAGTADLKFRLYGASAGGAQIGIEISKSGVTVDHGLFSVDLDFGDGAFLPGAARWLEVDVRSPAGSGNFETIAPRTAINPTPLAQGLSGATITRAGAAAVDQNQYDNQFNGVLPLRLDLTPIWQTFTAGKSGALTRIDLNGYGLVSGGGTQLISVKLRAGAGPGGAVLGTTTANVRQGQSIEIPLLFSNVSVVAGEQYTIDPTGLIFLVGSKIDLPGASAGPLPEYHFVFKTYVAPEATIDLKALRAGLADTARSVDWTNIGNIPSNLLASAGYWQAATNGISTTNRVGLGTTTPATTLHIKGEAGMLNLEGATHAYIQFFPQGMAAGRRAYVGIPGSGSNGFTVANEVSGGTLGLVGSTVQVYGNFVNTSDARDKHNVRAIDDALSLVARLRGVRFEWNQGGQVPFPAGEQIGFLAQDVESVLPELVQSGNGHKGVSYVSVVPLLTEAVKQLKSENERLRTEGEEQRRAMEELRARLEKLERAAR